jgi:hypothetical protein
MSILSLEERAGLSDAALELAVWRGIVKRVFGAKAFQAVERVVFDELKTRQ